MRAKFTTRPGLVPLGDGKNWELDGKLIVILEDTKGMAIQPIEVPDKFKTDLASVPPLGFLGGILMLIGHILSKFSPIGDGALAIGFLICIASIFLKAFGRYTYSAVVHDWIFQTHLFRFSFCNWILLVCMRAQKTAKWERFLIWLNVQIFGYFIYKNEKRIRKNDSVKNVGIPTRPQIPPIITG